jgi:hypothetical protein
MVCPAAAWDTCEARSGAGTDRLNRSRHLLLVAHRHHDMRAAHRQLTRGLQPEPAVGPSHDRHPAVQARDVCCTTAHKNLPE